MQLDTIVMKFQYLRKIKQRRDCNVITTRQKVQECFSVSKSVVNMGRRKIFTSESDSETMNSGVQKIGQLDAKM